MIRYAHTNLIVKNVPAMIAFYRDVLSCRSIGQARDLSGPWVNRLTGIENAHITGEHLALPGYGEGGPTLEIFGYDSVIARASAAANTLGFTHTAFAVDDVEVTLRAVLAHGGGRIGEIVHAEYADGRRGVFVCAADPEGNILELLSWR
jgi:glyoxylase I family protein